MGLLSYLKKRTYRKLVESWQVVDPYPLTIKQILTQPANEDIDEDEKILTYNFRGYTLEFEFNLENDLKRFNIYAEKG